MSKDNGGPAFPTNNGSDKFNVSGMTLRDYFAAKWLQGFIANSETPDESHEVVAGWAYTMADAMLKARES